MGIQAVPLIVLAVFATCAIVLYIGSCAVLKNWYPLFILIPAVLTCVFAYLFVKTGSGGLEGGCISKDTWLFLTVCCIVSIIGLPLVLYHCDVIEWKCLVMQLCADVITAVGFIVFIVLSKKYEDHINMW